MSLAAITDELREKYDLSEDVEGVVVTAVDEDSSAAEQRIQPGDVVTEVSQDEVQTPRELVAKVREVEESNRKSVVLTLTHGGELRFVALRLDRG
jgi:serine protease Do